MATITITGGTGLVGSALTKALVDKRHSVIILTRNADKEKATANITYAEWDLKKGSIDEKAIAEADYIVHLAGASVAEKRWTKKRKHEIVFSRVASGALIAKALKEIPNKVNAVVGASGIGWYGADPIIPNPAPFREDAPADNGFLGNTCLKWEQSLEPVKALGKRLIKLRFGIVMSKEGGAFVEFKKPMKFGVAPILGSGKQIISWIHIDDLVQLIIFSLENEAVEGVYNAVTPQPVSNKNLMLKTARARGNFFIPVIAPSFALNILLGEMSVEVLKSATISAEKIQNAGFEFLYPDFDKALESLLKK